MPNPGIDTFVRDRLPPREQWPQLVFTLPEMQYPARLNCVDRLLDRHVAAGRGDRRCLVAPGEIWSYDKLYRAANQIAHVLADDLGVRPGNRVLLRGYNTPMLAACWFAVLKTGGVAVTTMPLYRTAELTAIVEKARIRHALCDVRLLEDLGTAVSGRDDFSALSFGEGRLEVEMRDKPETFGNADTAAEDPAIIGFTSGTTGKPKAAVHFHRDILATCDSYGARVLRARAADLFTGSPPLGFTFGLGGLLLFPLDIGAATLLLEKAPPETLLQSIERYGANVIFTAPVAYRAMADLLSAYDLSALRVCVSAGETLPRPVWELWHEKTGLKILDGIGSTEMLHIFIGSPEEEVVGGSTGRAVPGYVAEIHDDRGNPVGADVVGRLAVKGPTGCKYLDDDRQGTYVQNGWNYPGDAYRQDPNGYFWYVARADDMIITAGYNVSGPEVEQALLAHADVKDCAVVAKPDRRHHTNIVKAYVVLESGANASEEKAAELQGFVRERIAAFKCPREVEFVDMLPRTETGKVQRYRLRELAASE